MANMEMTCTNDSMVPSTFISSLTSELEGHSCMSFMYCTVLLRKLLLKITFFNSFCLYQALPVSKMKIEHSIMF